MDAAEEAVRAGCGRSGVGSPASEVTRARRCDRALVEGDANSPPEGLGLTEPSGPTATSSTS